MVTQPERRLHRADPPHLSPSVSEEEVPPEQQHCEQEWSPHHGQDDPEPTQIKEEQEDLRTRQEEKLLQELEFDTKDSIFDPPCVNSDLDQEDPPQPSQLDQTQTVDRERGTLPTNTTEEIKTEPDGEGYRVPEPTNDTQALSVNPDCSAKEKPCWCKDCGRGFYNNIGLTNHMRIHMWEKQFHCKDCGKCYNNKGNLTGHARAHIGDNSNWCKDCAKWFGNKGNLTMHIKSTHGPREENSYQCKDCGKCFNKKAKFTRHKILHAAKIHRCKDCDKCLSTKVYLIRHTKLHSGENPYHCKDWPMFQR
ncbi:zinc finger protein 846 [Coregonus clupeaformis]|uniref:zinc finger protein 846 n=1 Tax=Coregonus clupeaformis TaxID=59861 RepID=UPI001BE0789A|nr:zinc finger protein 846 [Coregonus clupeaformis]